MRRLGLAAVLFSALTLAAASLARAADPASTDFRPDPRSVERYGPAYRYPQAGWIVLHIEGEPYERGYQHGRLMAPEIAAFLRCSAALISSTAPNEGWQMARTLVNALFLRRYDKEYLEEMRGIADGATAAGARYNNRPIDLVDIAAINVWPEIETLESAVEALPTGLEGMRFTHPQPRSMPKPKPMHCSAFAATGPATVDGKVVFGHITMFGLYPSYYYNVWLDVKPAKGHRVIIQSYPGGIQSGLDYYMNDAGILVTETTIAQTQFNINGFTLASRIRQALQYADSIDKAVEILKTANNGLYTNEWLIADVKTNEIAMFELGTAKSRLYRSSKNEWFGDTPGFYWGCNNTKDREVRLETIPGVNDRPHNMVFHPSDRDKMWLRLYLQHKGKIDADFGKLAFTTPPLAAYHSLDAKFTTTDLAKDLKSWALFGPPLGKSWQPTDEEKRRYPEIKPLVSNPWTILHVQPPAKEKGPLPEVADVPESLERQQRLARGRGDSRREQPTTPAWHSTIFPKTDADIWLATAFANYERIVAENSKPEKYESPSDARERLAVQLYGYRSSYLSGARAGGDVPLAQTRSALNQGDWFSVASGKGVLVLQELHQLLGAAVFQEVMDTFGRANAGKEVTAAQFQACAEKVSGKPLGQFFEYWLGQAGLPVLRLESASCSKHEKGYRVEGVIAREGQAPTTVVRVVVETAKGEESTQVTLEGPTTPFALETKQQPRRVILDKYGETAKAQGGVYTTLTFHGELEQTLIVYGTLAEVAANREAAEDLQKAIVRRHSNFTVPVKSDQEVKDEDLKSHHLLLIGRPDCNAIVKRLATGLPIAFGWRSFEVRHTNYAHAGSAVAAAAENPANPRFSIVVVAGLSPEATLHAAPALLGHGWNSSEVVVWPNHGQQQAIVVPARDLVKELPHDGDLLGKKESPRPKAQ